MAFKKMKTWENRQRKIRAFSELEYADNKEEKRSLVFKELAMDPMTPIEKIDLKCQQAGFGGVGLRTKLSILRSREAYLQSFKNHYTMKLTK